MGLTTYTYVTYVYRAYNPFSSSTSRTSQHGFPHFYVLLQDSMEEAAKVAQHAATRAGASEVPMEVEGSRILLGPQ